MPLLAPLELPLISGQESEILASMHLLNQQTTPSQQRLFPTTPYTVDYLSAGFSCALHMHQPTIPAGRDGALISNLQLMFDNPHQGDNHNAATFAWCYRRMGTFIPELVAQGCQPRIMLDYSGNLLWGVQQMGREDILESLRGITCNAQYYPYVEWLGTMWSHAVVPSTPIPDLKLHIQA